MAKPYSSAFLIPLNSRKIFDDMGWSFETEDRLCTDVLEKLQYSFLLEKEEEYNGIVVYAGDGLKASVVYDEYKLIEHIVIQLKTVSIEELKKVLCDPQFCEIEVFVPSCQ